MTTYLSRALETAAAARRSRAEGDSKTVCNRAYYAMFYCAQGLLDAAGEEEAGKTHASLLRLFSHRVVLGGDAPPELARALAVAQNLRSKADYSLEGASGKDADDALAAMERLLEFAKPRLEPEEGDNHA